jgi:ribonuclease P protein component
MSSATFPAAARLLRPSEFAAALAGKRVGRGVLFAVSFTLIATENNPSFQISSADSPVAGYVSQERHARLGLVMGKRHAKLAVTRNTLKRVVRDVFRRQRHELPCADFVVRLHRRVEDTSLTALKRLARADVEALFSKAKLISLRKLNNG